jgi:hypothetical protein
MLLLLGLLTRGSPWLSWFIAVSAVLTAWWTTIAAGPAPNVFRGPDLTNLTNSRWIRAVYFNVFAGAWLFAVARHMGDDLELPLIITVTAVLWASGVGRNLQVAWFAEELSVGERRVCAGVALLVAVLLGYLAIQNGSKESWQVPLFIVVLACTVLRRAAPVDVDFVSPLRWFGYIILFNGFRYLAETSSADNPNADETSVEGLIIAGSLFFLSGVAVAAIRVLRRPND